ncbi:MAG: hypothetical protein ACOZBW_07895 [Thermodesulfobacteriota bacterium]
MSEHVTRIFHELIWPQVQGAGREAAVNLLRAACNTADAAKAARPKGEIFRHKKMPQVACDSLYFQKTPEIHCNIPYLIQELTNVKKTS